MTLWLEDTTGSVVLDIRDNTETLNKHAGCLHVMDLNWKTSLTLYCLHARAHLSQASMSLSLMHVPQHHTVCAALTTAHLLLNYMNMEV